MANIIQKIFRPEYQWRLLDMVETYDIKEDFRQFDTNHITPCGHQVFGKGSTREYVITTDDTYVITRRNYDSTFAKPISVELYVHRTRQDGDKRVSEHREKDTEFAYKMYNKMRDKYITEREFSW